MYTFETMLRLSGHRISFQRRYLAAGNAAVFDRVLKMRQRAHALEREENEEYEYLREAAASRVVERLRDVASDRPLQKILDVGCHTGHIQRALVSEGLTEDERIELSQCEAY